MANTRELSQLASLINVVDENKSIGIVTSYPNAYVGIGSMIPAAKVDVAGDALVSGIVSATSFYGDGSNLSGIVSGFGTEESINTTGIITASSFYGDGSNLSGLSTFSGNYDDLINKPEIPSLVGYATEGYVDATKSLTISTRTEAKILSVSSAGLEILLRSGIGTASF